MERSVLYDLHLEVPWETASRVLREQAATLVTDDGDRHLTVHSHVGGFDVAREVIVSIGAPQRLDRHAITIPVAWEAAESPARFPVTDGVLELTDMSHSPPLCGLTFVGTVTSPFGLLGGIGDVVGGRAVVDDTMQAVLEQIGARLVAAVRAEQDAGRAPQVR